MKASFRAFVDQFLESRFLNTGPFASSLIFRGIAVFIYLRTLEVLISNIYESQADLLLYCTRICSTGRSLKL